MWATQYLQTALGLSPLMSAIAFAPMGLGIAAGTSLAPALAKRLRGALHMVGAVAAIALLACALVNLAPSVSVPASAQPATDPNDAA